MGSRNSAGREAARIRRTARKGVWGHVSAWLGLNPEAAAADAVAARWELGAEAERETARRLRVLRLYGWRIRHDLRLTGRRFNLDHVLVSPCGTAAVVADTKRWPVGRTVTADRGRLWLVGRDGSWPGRIRLRRLDVRVGRHRWRVRVQRVRRIRRRFVWSRLER